MKFRNPLFAFSIFLLISGCIPLFNGDDDTLVESKKLRYVVLKGRVLEEYTKQPISSMRILFGREVTGGYFSTADEDSIFEVFTNANGEYHIGFWHDNSNIYQLRCFGDSTLLPDSNYSEVTWYWGFREGSIFQHTTLPSIRINNADTMNLNVSVKSYSYITVKLKQITGFNEPISDYEVFVNGDTIKNHFIGFKFPINYINNYKETILLSNVDHVKVEVHLYRLVQSDKFLSKIVVPDPMKIKVVEFEF